MLRSLLLVGAGGAAGSMVRYGASLIIGRLFASPINYTATFFINVLGCLLIGLLFGFLSKQQMSDGTWLILATGFCGGFTTFSTFALENVNLMQKGQTVTAIIYTGASVVVGLLLCRVGIWLAG